MTKVLHLSGKHKRKGGLRNNFQVIVPNGLITCAEDEKIVMTMHDFMTPYTFYPVNSNNNKIKISVDGGATFDTVSIGEGFYDVTTLGTQIKTVINGLHTGLIISATVPLQTNLVINASASFTLDFDFVGSAGRLLGFIEEGFKTSQTVGLNQQLISETSVHLTPDHAIYLHCDHESKHLLTNSESQKVGYGHVIARIPIQVPPNSTIFMSGFTPQPLDFVNSYVSELSFKVTNERNEFIDLKDDIHMTLNFDVVKKQTKDPILEKLEEINQTFQAMYRLEMMSFISASK